MLSLNKVILSVAIGVSTAVTSFAQGVDPTPPGTDTSKYANTNWKPSLVADGVISKVDHDYRVTPWKMVRENDVAWYHRVWSVIPVREKANAPFMYTGDEYTNGGAFIEILNHAIKTGKITAYSSGGGYDDRFTTELSPEEFLSSVGGGFDTSEVWNDETQEYEITVYKKEFKVTDVTRYLVKEDVYFDRNAGRSQRRIMGIAPVIDIYEGGTYAYSQILYWIYYPEARQELGKYEVYNPKNMVKRMTWADYLEGNYYSSYVNKYSKNNPTNKAIKSMSVKENNLRALVEGEKVIEDLLNQELDMWER